MILVGTKLLLDTTTTLDLDLQPDSLYSTPNTNILTSEQQLEVRRKKALHRVREYQEQYHNESAQILQETQTSLDKTYAEAHTKIPKAVKDSTEPMQGFKAAVRMSYYGAVGKISQSTKLNDYLAEAILPIRELLIETVLSAQTELDACHQRLIAADNQFRAAVLALGNDLKLSTKDLDLPNLTDVNRQLENLIKKDSTAVITATIDGSLLSSTVKIITSVLGKIITRVSTSLGVSGTIAIADGPLPIGDIIGATLTVGGTIWSAINIMQAVEANKALPEKLSDAVCEQLDSSREQSNQALVDLHQVIA